MSHGAWIQVFWKCGSGVDRREIIVLCSLFVVKHDERNNPRSQRRYGVVSLQDGFWQSVYRYH